MIANPACRAKDLAALAIPDPSAAHAVHTVHVAVVVRAAFGPNLVPDQVCLA